MQNKSYLDEILLADGAESAQRRANKILGKVFGRPVSLINIGVDKLNWRDKSEWQ